MILINVTNKDCSVRVDPFYDAVGLAKLMTLNKEINAQAMKQLGKTYCLTVPRKGLMHMGRLLSARNQGIAKKHMLPGTKHAEAALRMECMLCKKKCPSILVYGFVGHSKCIRGKEKNFNEWKFSKNNSEYNEMWLHDLHHLRKRAGTHVIEKAIPGVFPHSLSLEGYLEERTTAYRVEIVAAKTKAATRKRKLAEKEEREAKSIEVCAKKDEHQANIVKADIETITGMSSQMFFRKNGYDAEDIEDCVFRKSGFDLEELPCVLRFENGQQCVDALLELNKRSFSKYERLNILRSEAGETISSREVFDRMRLTN